MSDVERQEVRCPTDARRLFTVMILEKRQPIITDGNLMEFKCDNCTKNRKRQHPNIVGVYHYYDIAGRYVETLEDREEHGRTVSRRWDRGL